MNNPPENHDLTLVQGGGGSCTCGTPFEGRPAACLKAWQDHVEKITLIAALPQYASAEREARRGVEDTVRRLLALGVSSSRISGYAGEAEGKPILSKTLIQRLGRDEHVQTPRRRRA